jgi:hypothetical protein
MQVRQVNDRKRGVGACGLNSLKCSQAVSVAGIIVSATRTT